MSVTTAELKVTDQQRPAQAPGRVSEQRRRLGEARPQAVDDLLELCQGAGMGRLREDGPDDRRHGRERVA